MSLCLTTTAHDERWQRLNLFPFTASLLLLAVTNTVLSICVVSVAATESIPCVAPRFPHASRPKR